MIFPRSFFLFEEHLLILHYLPSILTYILAVLLFVESAKFYGGSGTKLTNRLVRGSKTTNN